MTTLSLLREKALQDLVDNKLIIPSGKDKDGVKIYSLIGLYFPPFQQEEYDLLFT